MAIYAAGGIRFAEEFADYDPSLQRGMIELRTHLEYERELRNLHVQESRLTRRYEKEMVELRALQKDRASQETKAAPVTAKAAPAVGFDFSTASRDRRTAKESHSVPPSPSYPPSTQTAVSLSGFSLNQSSK